MTTTKRCIQLAMKALANVRRSIRLQHDNRAKCFIHSHHDNKHQGRIIVVKYLRRERILMNHK